MACIPHNIRNTFAGPGTSILGSLFDIWRAGGIGAFYKSAAAFVVRVTLHRGKLHTARGPRGLLQRACAVFSPNQVLATKPAIKYTIYERVRHATIARRNMVAAVQPHPPSAICSQPASPSRPLACRRHTQARAAGLAPIVTISPLEGFVVGALARCALPPQPALPLAMHCSAHEQWCTHPAVVAVPSAECTGHWPYREGVCRALAEILIYPYTVQLLPVRR